MKDFKDKIIVITGGATGIGLSFAKRFGKKGGKVVIAGRRLDRVEQSVESLKAEGVEAAGTSCDVTKEDDVKNLLDFTLKTFRKVDILVNNAGVSSSLKPAYLMSHEEIMMAFNVNLFGAWNGVRVFAKHMIDQGEPCAIYNVGSENSFFNGVPGAAEYVASKHAIHAMTVALHEDTPDFMTVGLICPGLVNSELGEGITFGMDTDQYTEIAMKQIREGEFYIVSHAYNMKHIDDRHNEIRHAYETYAPRYADDQEFDVRTLMAQMSH